MQKQKKTKSSQPSHPPQQYLSGAQHLHPLPSDLGYLFQGHGGLQVFDLPTMSTIATQHHKSHNKLNALDNAMRYCFFDRLDHNQFYTVSTHMWNKGDMEG